MKKTHPPVVRSVRSEMGETMKGVRECLAKGELDLQTARETRAEQYFEQDLKGQRRFDPHLAGPEKAAGSSPTAS
jgi:hypothetical protein